MNGSNKSLKESKKCLKGSKKIMKESKAIGKESKKMVKGSKKRWRKVNRMLEGSKKKAEGKVTLQGHRKNVHHTGCFLNEYKYLESLSK